MANPVQPQFPPAREPGAASPLDLPEMEMLLTKVEDQADKALKLPKSLSGALDLEQNGHGLPFKVVSEGHREASLPRSPSRASSRRASSTATASYAQDREAPKDYLILAIASCFCPVWPLNLIPLIFSIMVSAALCSRAGWVRGGRLLRGMGAEKRELGPRGWGRDLLFQLANYPPRPPPLEEGPGQESVCLLSFISALDFVQNPVEEGAPGSPWS